MISQLETFAANKEDWNIVKQPKNIEDNLVKSGRNWDLLTTIFICLILTFLTACGKIDTDTLEMSEDAAADPILTEENDWNTASPSAKSLICLKNGDTESLVGLSFGDEFDYDRYVISGWSSDETYYRLKDAEYGSVSFVFNGKGKGFSGLKKTWEGDFCGITLGEDTLETLTDVLGEPDMLEEKKIYGERELWATWHFETASLSARIEDGKIRAMEYCADGDIADAREKTEAETDFGKDRSAGEGCAEVIYRWRAYGSSSEGAYAIYHPHHDDYDESKVDEFIHNYLLEQGIDKEKPDGVSYNQNGDTFVEYYVDREKEQYCFVVHLWADYWVDYKKGISKYQDAVYCTAYTLDEDDKAGYLIYEQNEEKALWHEKLYDMWGKKMAAVSYEYIPGTPFPFITESWNLNSGFFPSAAALIRNQKTWFYKEQAQFDKDGKFISYNGSIDEERGGEYFCYPCRTVYDTEGRLYALQEEMQAYDIEINWGWWDESSDYSGQMEFSYYEDGTIKNVDYIRSSYTHGTTDSSGYIYYDEKGRMIYNDYYITHGGDSSILLYEDDSTMPWCVFHWCSYLPGFEEVYLFLPKS